MTHDRQDRASIRSINARMPNTVDDKMTTDVTVYFNKCSRAFVPHWLVGELGIPYRIKTVLIARRKQKAAGDLRLNPTGKVPMLIDGEAIMNENPAICLLLADRYGYGTLAPRIDQAAQPLSQMDGIRDTDGRVLLVEPHPAGPGP